MMKGVCFIVSLGFCFVAFSNAQPVSTLSENALAIPCHQAGEVS